MDDAAVLSAAVAQPLLPADAVDPGRRRGQRSARRPARARSGDAGAPRSERALHAQPAGAGGRARAASQPGAAHRRRDRAGVGGDAAAVPAVGLLRGARGAGSTRSAASPAAASSSGEPTSPRWRRDRWPPVPCSSRSTHTTRVGISVTDALVARAAHGRRRSRRWRAGGMPRRGADGAARRARSTRRRLLHTTRHAERVLSTEGTWTAIRSGPAAAAGGRHLLGRGARRLLPAARLHAGVAAGPRTDARAP